MGIRRGYGGNDDPDHVSGTYAHVTWNDQPSITGAGSYTLAVQAAWDSLCGDHESKTLSPNDSLTVNKPTISGFTDNNSFWNLGPGSADPQITTNNAYYYQSAVLTFNSNCGAGDTCTDVPQWSLIAQNGQTQLSSTTGSPVTIRKGTSQGDCLYDSTLSVSMGGFSSDPYMVLVNSPKFIVHAASQDITLQAGSPPDGYLTNWTIGVEDACAFPNGVWQIPMSESFSGSGQTASGTSGWSIPNSGGVNWDEGDWISQYNFVDTIGVGNCSSCTPPSTWTSYYPPFTYNTRLFWQPHFFQAGTTSPSTGWPVYSGTIEYYQDHGDNTCANSPGC
ncbi:MAG TPA: hypothetical protein VFW83_03335 [Bryobacteraceae bacterium]|nr:hypothetical protein [Bryobacteraceae bacterium]